MNSTGRFTPALRRLMNDSYDSCRTCGRALPANTPAFAGYAEDGSLLYVGECCKASLKELATYVYWWWKADKRVAAETTLWRYMDFARFVSLIDSQSLHFARADQFSDPFEAASGSKELKPRWDAFYLDFFREAIRTSPGVTEPPSDERVDSGAARLLSSLTHSALTDRERLFVNCWHANEGESEALWRLYCPPPTAGVAIKTTSDRLLHALAEAPIEIGRVQYRDFAQSFAGIHDRIFFKRKSLSHETEVRLVIKEFEPTAELGKLVPVDLATLITVVVPSPFAPVWFMPLLKSTLGRFGVHASLRKSEILDEPFF